MTTFVRVKDRDTKHEFDVPEDDKRIGVAFDVVKGTRYPPTTRVRAPKHHVKLAGRPASRETASSSEASAEASTQKESHDG